MNTLSQPISRRSLIRSSCLMSVALAAPALAQQPPAMPLINRPIASSGELLHVVGMGTSQTFNREVSVTQLAEVTRAFFAAGGQLIDSSPMYGPAEELIGEVLKQVDNSQQLFTATKVWTDGKEAGIRQMHESQRLMGRNRIDLMQVHNLRDWKIHLATLREWKQQGVIRYLGITTSHGRFHAELEDIMRGEALDFVQLSYNLADREVEHRLLPLALDKGIAVLANRPFQNGDLFTKTRGKALPDWAAEIDCTSWGQLFLKFIISHPAIGCVIPATNKLSHMLDNMVAGRGRIADAGMRKRIIALLD